MTTNNNRQCPVCRSPLPQSRCKMCGFQQKKMQVQVTVDEGRINVLGRIRDKTNKSATRYISSHWCNYIEKITTYLRQYARVLKQSTIKFAQQKQLSPEQAQLLNQRVFAIWKSYLLKVNQQNQPFLGILKKYCFGKDKAKKQTQKQKLQAEDSKEDKNSAQCSKQQKIQPQDQNLKRSHEQHNVAKKQSSQLTKQVLAASHQLRSYYKVSVSGTLSQSIQERKIDQYVLTPSQKAYLSYLIAFKEIDEQFVKEASHKYIRLVLKIKSGQRKQSYLNDKQIQAELNDRQCKALQVKQLSILLILMVDLLRCCLNKDDQITRLSYLISQYQGLDGSSQIIDHILQKLQNSKDNTNDPETACLSISFQMVYAIIYLGSVQTGFCFTISQIVATIGHLSIPSVSLQQQGPVLPAIVNQQSIYPNKTRKLSHKLAEFLQLKFSSCILAWNQKFCKKLSLLCYLSQINQVTQIVFSQMLKSQAKPVSYKYSSKKKQDFHRFMQLDQDIYTLAGIFIFVKLSLGLTNYPYLVNFVLPLGVQLSKDRQENQVVNKLCKNRAVVTKNKMTLMIVKQQLPLPYQRPINALQLCKNIEALRSKDKEMGDKALYKQNIKLRSLQSLNYMTSTQISDLLCTSQQNSQKNQNEISLKFDISAHRKNIQIAKLKAKKQQPKVPTVIQKSLNSLILKQLSCIVDLNEQLVEQINVDGQPGVCLVDQPSTNYELMFEYSGDNLIGSGRLQQLYLMEQLCLNVCSFNQLGATLVKMESVLKLFQIQQ